MQRLLVIAISLSLTAVAGCSAPSQHGQTDNTGLRQDADLVSDERLLKEKKEDDQVRGRREAETPQHQVAGSSEAAKQISADQPIADIAIVQPAPALASRPASTALIAPPSPPVSNTHEQQPAEYREIANRENYAELKPNQVTLTSEHPVSTFSIDVDTGSFSNVRRQLENGLLPPANAVRSEELINWFDFGYRPPDSLETPFSVTTELAPAPWNAERQLLLLGLKGYEIPATQIPAVNLVFLVDTSGSMQSEDKLGLLKRSLGLLSERMRAQDRIAIVAYAGSAGLVLPATSGRDKATIMDALDRLQAGGSTNGGAGIELAYQVAQQQFIDGGVNRVILATDGDFNVGTVSIDALKSLIRARRETGIALTTLGFGRDNYNDELAEQLADIGNGNHAYIDRIEEANKVLVEEMSSTLLTIAADVKIQLEFNPAVVAEYRLIGYENRALNREDFNNDQVDAGEIGAGHDVTALYELTLVDSRTRQISPLRYASAPLQAKYSDELGFLRLRYKPDGESASRLIEQPIRGPGTDTTVSPRLQLAATVAAFAELLRGTGGVGALTYRDLQSWLDTAPHAAPDDQLGTLRAMIAQADQLAAQHTAQVN